MYLSKQPSTGCGGSRRRSRSCVSGVRRGSNRHVVRRELLGNGVHQLLDAVRDPLRGTAKQRYGPFDGVALGHIVGRGVVHQPLGERMGQHQVALGKP